LAKKDEIPLRALENQPLAVKSVEPGREHRIVDRCLELGFVPDVRYESGNLASLHSLCMSGEIVAVSTSFVESAFPNDELKVIRLAERIPQNVFLVSKTREIQDRAVMLFEDYVKKIAPKRAP
jgi:DNA-binding transcriptional LysR family regulator